MMNDFDTTTEGNRGLLRPMLWVLLFVSATANAVLSSLANGVNDHSTLFQVLGVAAGVVALTSAAALITHHYRGRRSHG